MNQIAERIVSEDIHTIVDDIRGFSNILEGKRLLLVGGKGFLGTYFLKTAIGLNKIFKKPMQIVVLDNLITAKEVQNDYGEFVEFIEADISTNPHVEGGIDYIIHAASIASPPVYRKFPLKTIDVNYQGTRNLLDLAREHHVKSMLFLSSSEIYGDPDVIPTPEEYWGYVSSTGPRACYDESKRLAETVSLVYHEQFNVPVRIARPFNVYGPYLNLNDGRVIPDFMKNAISNSKIIIHSDGTPTRSFCYVSDAIRAFYRILLLSPPGDAFNVGNDEEISMKEVAEKIKKIINKPIEIVLEKSKDPNYTKDNPQRRCPDLTKIRQIGYQPQVKLEEGLRRLYQWYLGV